MSENLQQQPSYHSEQQQQVISQIKRIASQIFENQVFIDKESLENQNGQIMFDFQQKFMKMKGKNNKNFQGEDLNQRKYPYTQRNFRQMSISQCPEDDWISEDMNLNKHSNFKEMNNFEKIKKDDLKLNIGKINDKNNHNHKKIQPNKKQLLKQKNNSPQRKNFKKKIVQKKSNEAHNSNLLKPIGHLKQSTKQYLYELQLQKKLQQSRHTDIGTNKSRMKHLQQIYAQKVPLYEKFLVERDKKRRKIEISRIIQTKKQVQEFVGTPKINNNIEVEGKFEERVRKAERKKQQNKLNVIVEALEPYSFKPKLNKTSKYKVQSVVKKAWEGKNKPTSNETQQIQSQYFQNMPHENLFKSFELKGISHSLLKTGSFFSQQDSSVKNNKSVDVKLKNPNQLSYILEIQDFIQQ